MLKTIQFNYEYFAGGLFRDKSKRQANGKCPVLHGNQILEEIESKIRDNFILIPKTEENIEYYI